MNIIKKYTGLIGFLIALTLICISAYYKYFHNSKFETLVNFAIIIWITSMVLQYELNKVKPRNWFIILVTIIFFIFMLLSLYN